MTARGFKMDMNLNKARTTGWRPWQAVTWMTGYLARER